MWTNIPLKIDVIKFGLACLKERVLTHLNTSMKAIWNAGFVMSGSIIVIFWLGIKKKNHGYTRDGIWIKTFLQTEEKFILLKHVALYHMI